MESYSSCTAITHFWLLGHIPSQKSLWELFTQDGTDSQNLGAWLIDYSDARCLCIFVDFGLKHCYMSMTWHIVGELLPKFSDFHKGGWFPDHEQVITHQNVVENFIFKITTSWGGMKSSRHCSKFSVIRHARTGWYFDILGYWAMAKICRNIILRITFLHALPGKIPILFPIAFQRQTVIIQHRFKYCLLASGTKPSRNTYADWTKSLFAATGLHCVKFLII